VILTAAQACIRYLASQFVDVDGDRVRFFAGAWAIFGHGNVAGLGEALHACRDQLPTLRAHNEQAMGHAAIAYAKAQRRRRAMICTSSVGPGATNMVTPCALAHVNRLPVLFLPGDVFAGRGPDPVLQQVEDFADGTVSANDCFRPVSRFFDRIARPEQLIAALPRTMAMLTDAAACGPATLAFCQDAQTEAFDYPPAFFEPRLWRTRRQDADPREIADLARLLKAAVAPLIIAGGGVIYGGAETALAEFALTTGIPVAETQGGKGALIWDHPCNLGAIGVTGTSAANGAAGAADLVIGIGTRLTDFTTGSRGLFANRACRLAQINVGAFDAHKHGALAVVGDAVAVLAALAVEIGDWQVPVTWRETCSAGLAAWNRDWHAATAPTKDGQLASDAQVLGAVWRAAPADAVVVCAAGGVPGELHKLWRTRAAGGYHVEYGYSCMGYEIAGGLGVKLADPSRGVIVMVGDGSYLMLNSEIATSVSLGQKLIIVVLDNGGFGCIDRLQRSLGSAPFNNLLPSEARVDFAAHAASLGALADVAIDIAGLEAAMARALAADRTSVIVIATDPAASTEVGGAWWDVPVSEVSERPEVVAARESYEAARHRR